MASYVTDGSINKEEEILLANLLEQDMLNGRIHRGRDFVGESQSFDQQCELIGDLPDCSGAALDSLNRLLTAFPSYSGPNRLVRAAQAQVAVVHAKAASFVDHMKAGKAQARVAVKVAQKIEAKKEAERAKDREKRARAMRARENQPSVATLMRGPDRKSVV